jgi:LacI family transcriptional regulator
MDRKWRDPKSATEPSLAANLRKAPRLKDVAKLAGVSVQTVSLVVNNKGSVGKEMRDRIGRIAADLGYLPNRSAKAMRTGRSQTIGLVVSDIRSPFVPELAYVVQQAAAAAGYSVIFVDTHCPAEEADRRVGVLKGHVVDGIVATHYLPAIRHLGLPTVIIGEPARGMDSITSDDVQGGQLIADFLLDQGHTVVGLVSTPAGNECVRDRREAFIKRFSVSGDIVWEAYTPPAETISENVRLMLARRDVTAIVCSHDVLAIRLLRAIQESNLNVPEDFSVVGFDDISWASMIKPALTTVRQPYAGLGQGAIDLLLDRFDNPTRRNMRLKLPVHLVARETVAPPTHQAGSRRPLASPEKTSAPA